MTVYKNSKQNSFLMILAAFIWGTAFVAQSKGGDLVGPFTFNCLRSLIGGCALLPAIFLLDKFGWTKNKPAAKADWKLLLRGGISCGVVLFFATNLQQLGIQAGSPAGKAGFLTACYILLVPVFGLFLKKKCGWNVWTGIVIAVVGLFLLCMDGSFTLQYADILILLCAVVFAIHILVIDHFSPLVDGVRMSCIQFLVTGVLSAIPMILTEVGLTGHQVVSWTATLTNLDAWLPILYAGVLSSGVAYTLQIIGQKDYNPAIASLLLSLESVFAVLAGWVILQERLSGRQLAGCALLFAAIILAQIPTKK